MNLSCTVKVDPWVTKHGEEPLISEEENNAAMVTEVTEEEINRAISKIVPVFMVVGYKKKNACSMYPFL